MSSSGTRVGVYLLVGTFAIVGPALSQDSSYPFAFVHYVEGTATLQRATEPYPEEASVNMPIAPGDRVWTGASSRVEIQFGDGSVARFSENSRVDFVELDGEILLQLWTGSMILNVADPSTRVRIDTPTATIYPQSEVRLRIDVEEGGGAVDLTVHEGAAELASPEGTVLVRSRNKSRVVAGERPELLNYLSTSADAFDAWSDGLERPAVTSSTIPRGYISGFPREVEPYVDELSEHGEWQRDASHGYVWYPSVSYGWAPYRSERWCYTRYGYTWISYERWGWAPYHYGRWGHSAHGWYWVPGRHWAPAWVSFSVGPAWVAWSPLGHHGRSVFGFHCSHGNRGGFYGRDHRYRGGRRGGGHHDRGGKAVPRGVHESGAGWTIADRRGFGSGRARLRGEDIADTAHRARTFETGAVLNRDLTARANGRDQMARVVTRTRGARGVQRAQTAAAVVKRCRTAGRASGTLPRREKAHVRPCSRHRPPDDR